MSRIRSLRIEHLRLRPEVSQKVHAVLLGQNGGDRIADFEFLEHGAEAGVSRTLASTQSNRVHGHEEDRTHP